MLNHFRSLLLNLDYTGDGTEHIPAKFIPIQLPAKLKNLHTALFPETSSRFYKMVLAHTYLNILDAAGFSEEVTIYDPRISYDLTDSSFFKVNITSNPKVSDSRFPVFVQGVLNQYDDRDYYYDVFLIKQKDDSLNISVYSRNKAKYLLGVSEYTDPNDALIPVVFSSGSSNICFAGTSGIRFSLGGSNSLFQSTSNKSWEFSVESPIKTDIATIYNRVVALNPFNILRTFKIDIADYEYIWNTQKNLLYKLAAFLLAYVKVLNSLCPT